MVIETGNPKAPGKFKVCFGKEFAIILIRRIIFIDYGIEVKRMVNHKAVLLSRVLEALELENDYFSGYIHPQNGEVLLISEETMQQYENLDVTGWENYKDWEIESIKEAQRVREDSKFIKLPTKYDIHEYRIMEDFIGTLENGILQDEFYRAIQGKGAFQRFENKLDQNGLDQDWFKYRNDRFAAFLRDWLRSNKIHFVDDLRK